MNFRNQEKHCVNTALTMRVNAVMSQNLLQRHMWQKGSLQANNLKKGAKKMTKELYEKLDMASKTLCEYCENAECSCCQVTRLMDDAYIEAVEEGIVDDA